MDNDKEKKEWYLGVFYFNQDNEKVFVPKRFGIGWTLNFARWQSLLIIGILLISITFAILKPFR